LVAADGMLIRKYFVPNYQHRVTASAVILREFGTINGDAAAVTLRSGALTIEIGISGAKAFAGQEIGFFARFKVDPGWHVYGTPLPGAYTATSIAFDDSAIARQSFELPEAQPMKISALDETLPVHGGSFQGLGSLLLKFPFPAGRTMLRGKLRFQQCSDAVCEAPETVSFELPLIIEPMRVAPSKK
jgi:Disulphide bond corrector protein DsbC